jgi:hypothetical protein
MNLEERRYEVPIGQELEKIHLILVLCPVLQAGNAGFFNSSCPMGFSYRLYAYSSLLNYYLLALAPLESFLPSII